MSLALDASRERAWGVGFGTDTVDPHDPDMVDANTLSVTDASGAALWHPRGLEDIDALPERTWLLWLDMRDGMASRSEPWSWWRSKGLPTAHQHPASPQGATRARCGWEAAPGTVWVRASGPPHCGACTALDEGRPTAAWGEIGGQGIGRD